MRFIVSLLIFAFGFAVMKYAYNLMQWFGRISWAEETFGATGTHTMYKLVGLIFTIIAILHLFGALEAIFAPLASIFGGGR